MNTTSTATAAQASNNNNASARKSVGQKLDEVLEPFVKDRARLQSQMREQKQLRAQIDQQVKEIQRDLEVIEHSMIQAVRDAAKHDPLLSAAFHLTGDSANAGLPALNPLLKPDDGDK